MLLVHSTNLHSLGAKKNLSHLSMENHMIFSFLFLVFLLKTSLSWSLDNYSLPEKYFINCGSASRLALPGRTSRFYEGDVQKSFGNPVNDSSSSNATQLYQSAWVFTKPSSYDLDIDLNGTYVVRFHFLPFQAMGNLGNARFNVDASGVRLLSNFSVGGDDGISNNSPRVEELLLTIAVGKLRINFVPYNASCFAFVNAMEVFIAPPDFISDAVKHVTEQGDSGELNGLLAYPLRVIHRINVGGSDVTPDIDPLLRSWIPDDGFLFSKVTAKNSTPYNGDNIKYGRPGATEFESPRQVSSTAKQMNTESASQNNDNFNVSWRFHVTSGTQHYVRVLFCDIVSNTSNEHLKFNLFVYRNFRETISPYDRFLQTAAPFFSQYIVASDDSGFMNVSIGPRADSEVKTAFLNGIEIMELVTDTAPKGSGSTKRRGLFVILGSSLGGLLVLVALVLSIVFCFRKRKWRRPLESQINGGSSYTTTIDPGTPLADLNLGLKITLHEILYATKQFDSKLIIGEGGFGKVYKGILKNGTKVAVKRSESGQGQGLSEFETEITVLSKIRHQHLVSLIGYCNERGEMILVYEYMERGTLRDHLYSKDHRASASLSWDQRLNICIGAAKGILYLHTGSNGSIIHRDIKSTNILLDENYVAKVADFGLSRSEQLGDDSHVVTGVKGTFGYLDPEYCRSSQPTHKSDVYSFGVVLLEVLCGRPVIDLSLPEERAILIDWAMHWQRKGRIEDVVDPALEGSVNSDCLRKYGEIIAKCLQEEGSDRPGMIDVLWDLEYCLKLQRSGAKVVKYDEGMSYNTDMSLDLSAGVIRRLPSHSMPIDEDDLDEAEKGYYTSLDSSVPPNEVFSQLRIDEAR